MVGPIHSLGSRASRTGKIDRNKVSFVNDDGKERKTMVVKILLLSAGRGLALVLLAALASRKKEGDHHRNHIVRRRSHRYS